MTRALVRKLIGGALVLCAIVESAVIGATTFFTPGAFIVALVLLGFQVFCGFWFLDNSQEP